MDSPYSPPPSPSRNKLQNDAEKVIGDRDPMGDMDSVVSEDSLSMAIAGFVLGVSLLAVLLFGRTGDEYASPLGDWIGKPGKWTMSPIDAFVERSSIVTPVVEQSAAEVEVEVEAEDVNASGELSEITSWAKLVGTLGTGLSIGLLSALALALSMGRAFSFGRYLVAFAALFVLSTLAYVMAAQSVIKSFNLEYALRALGVGLLISNTVRTPAWLRPAIRTELFIKTGLVLLGAEVLISRLLALGLPGVFVAWIVTPIVLISTYAFGQRVLKMKSPSLNMVISADMSVCGVSAAIAASAACKAKKEELSLAIGMSLAFTVVMMLVLPIIIRFTGMDPVVGAAWMGGTIDSTGAVAAAGAALGEEGLQIAATVKMIQNILIGVSAFGIAVYWVTRVEKGAGRSAVGVGEIWRRFPKFVLGFVAASVVFSVVHAFAPMGPEITTAVIKGSSKTLRGYLFCLAFVCIGLETNFRDLLPQLSGGKPLILYVVGQSLNLLLTLLMAYLMFGVLFKDWVMP